MFEILPYKVKIVGTNLMKTSPGRESNSRPFAYQANALPTEPPRRKEIRGRILNTSYFFDNGSTSKR